MPSGFGGPSAHTSARRSFHCWVLSSTGGTHSNESASQLNRASTTSPVGIRSGALAKRNVRPRSATCPAELSAVTRW